MKMTILWSISLRIMYLSSTTRTSSNQPLNLVIVLLGLALGSQMMVVLYVLPTLPTRTVLQALPSIQMSL